MASFSCAICLSEWTDTDALRSLSCGHIFCESCVRQLLTQSLPLCPSCRDGPIQRFQLRRVFLNVELREATSNNVPSRGLEALAETLYDMRMDKRSLAKRGQEYGDQLMATRDALASAREEVADVKAEMAEVKEEMRRVREEHREATELSHSRLVELENVEDEIDCLRRELQYTREEARVNKAKYQNLNFDVNGAIKTLSMSSESLSARSPWRRSSCLWGTASNADKSPRFF